MSRNLYLGMAAFAMLVTTAARAEDSLEYYSSAGSPQVEQVSTLTVSSRVATLEAELESLRAQIHQASFGGGEGGKCYDCGAVGCNCYCDVGCGGWYAGIDAVIVKPHSEEGATNDVVDATNVSRFGEPLWDYEVSPRIWLGYRNCEGLGIRARWWNFDQDSQLIELDDTTDTDVSFGFHSLDVTALDLEATQLVCWGPLQMNFAGGVRYGKVESLGVDLGVGTADTETDAGLTDFEGFGPTLAMEARRPIGCGPWALLGNVRASMLFGDSKDFDVSDADTDVNFTADEIDRTQHEDKHAYVVESQIGVEYNRCLANGGVLSLRALMEGQIWMHVVGDDSFGASSSPDDSLGFFGAVIGAEYSR